MKRKILGVLCLLPATGVVGGVLFLAWQHPDGRALLRGIAGGVVFTGGLLGLAALTAHGIALLRGDP